MSKMRRAPRVGAEAKAIAKLSVQRKKKITEVIPPDVTRAKAGAWLDLISPITEWAGLKGDALRYRRAQLRIQQDDVLTTIAQKARQKLAGHSAQRPVPLKLLVPLLEKASLEDPNDEMMIEMWSNLLVSSTSESSIPPRFISLVGELNGRQARLFLDMSLRNIEKQEYPHLYPDATSYELQQNFVEQEITNAISKSGLTADSIYEWLMPLFELPGCALADLIVNEKNGESFSVPTSAAGSYGNQDIQSDLQILASLGLLLKVDIHRQVNKKSINNISVHYFYISEMGAEFLEAVSAKVVESP